MNIGDKVTFTVGCAGRDFSAHEGQEIVVNTRNANWIEDQLRAGYCKITGMEELPPASFRESEAKNEAPPVLPDSPKTKGRGGRKSVVPS